ncbi:MAG: endonuclease domain-containing protein [Clostridia bacterium]|nr:endonuclease domain-containing protein [Clostridia bacterium]
MNKIHNQKLTKNSQALRKNMTKEERKLWYEFLKELPVTFHRQKVINNYIVDFYCASANLVIEIDGTQHYLDKGKAEDMVRDDYLSSIGLTVLRYSNDDVNYSFDSVCQDIFNNLVARGVIPERIKTTSP